MSPEYWLKSLTLGLTASLVLLQAQVGRSLPPLAKDSPYIWYQIQQGRSRPSILPSASTPETATLSKEEADLLYARNDYARYQALFQEGAISRQQLDQAESAYKFAQAQYDRRQQLQRLQRSESTRSGLQTELAQAEADVQLKQLVYERYQRLYQEGAIGRSWLTQAEQDYQQALARRETMRKKLRSLP